jgi:putative FmdB family regulatory protein
MPTYEYLCNACGHRFDELQSFSDAPLKKCPSCKKKKLERLIGTGAAILFKGTGFYQTDYRSESYKSAAQADQVKPTDKSDKGGVDGTAKATDTKAASGSETKSEAKSTAKNAKK